MRSAPIVEVKSHFSAFLAAVEAGEEIVITRHGRPIWFPPRGKQRLMCFGHYGQLNPWTNLI